MPRKARLGDRTDHGGEVITASPNVIVNGKAAARLTDLVSCPIHGDNPIVSNVSSSAVITNDLNAAYLGSVSECGSIIVQASDDVTVDG